MSDNKKEDALDKKRGIKQTKAEEKRELNAKPLPKPTKKNPRF